MLGLKFEPVDLDRRPTFQVDLWESSRSAGSIRSAIPFVGLLVMQPADDVHFGASGVGRFLTREQ